MEGTRGERPRQEMMVRLSDTFGGGCVRCLFQEYGIEAAQKARPIGDGLSWVMDDTQDLTGAGWRREIDESAKPATRALAIPWASNFLRALHLLRRNTAGAKEAHPLPLPEGAARKPRSNGKGAS